MKLTSKRLKQMIKRELNEMMYGEANLRFDQKTAAQMNGLNLALNNHLNSTDQMEQVEMMVKKYMGSEDFPQTFDNALEMALNEVMPMIPNSVKGLIKQDVRSYMARAGG